jgi:hypothetical protein
VAYPRLTRASQTQERVMVEQLGKDGWDIPILNQRITAALTSERMVANPYLSLASENVRF